MTRLKFRRKEKKYTEVYNTIIFKNKNVELTGLYTTIQACIDLEINTKGTDKEFIVNKKTLQSFTGYKDDKFKRIWNELKQAGYLKQYKIKSESGKFEYEYELLDEPDLTTHHSLIVKDNGSVVPNIPKSKIDKLINENKPEVGNPSLALEGDFPPSGKKGDYYNTSLNKVCKYLCFAQENYSLSNRNKEYIQSIRNQIELDLFEQVVADANNKGKTFEYVVGTIDNLLKDNIFTLEDHLKRNKDFKPKKNTKRSTAPKKNKFHNFDQSIDNMTEEYVMGCIEKSQSVKFGNESLEEDKEDDYTENTDPERICYQKAIESDWENLGFYTYHRAMKYAIKYNKPFKKVNEHEYK